MTRSKSVMLSEPISPIAAREGDAAAIPKHMGTILFPDQITRAQFVKIRRELIEPGPTDVGIPQAVKDFVLDTIINNPAFLDRQRLANPKVLVSVTGGAFGYSIPEVVSSIFKKGLMKLAESTNAWIVTGGTDVGVMKAVGDAFFNSRLGNNVPCFGFVSSNALNNQPLFAEPPTSFDNIATGSHSPNQHSDHSREMHTVTFVKDPADKTRNITLNPYHSNFVLVDGKHYMDLDPKVGVFGHEIGFRSNVEAYLCSKEVFDIPVLLLCAGGGVGTLKTIAEGVRNDFPVVIINESGGVSDALSYLIQNNNNNNLPAENPWSTWEKTEKAAGRFKPEHDGYVKEITGSESVRIFNRLSGVKLDFFLFESLFKSEKYGELKVMMELAIVCDQLEILTDLLSKSEPSQHVANVQFALQCAVARNKPKIFDAMIQQSADRTLDLRALFNTIFERRARWERFYSILSNGTVRQLEAIEAALKKNSGEAAKLGAGSKIGNTIKGKSIVVSQDELVDAPGSPMTSSATGFKVLKLFLKDVFHGSGAMYEKYLTRQYTKLSESSRDSSSSLKASMIDVIIWALLLGYTDIAKVAWRHSSLPLHTALVATHFCKFLCERLPNENTVYEPLAGEFEQKGKDILEFITFKEAREVLEFTFDEMDLSLLEIATLGHTEDFTTHPFIQRYVDETLHKNDFGEIPVSTRTPTIILCTIIPFLCGLIYRGAHKPYAIASTPAYPAKSLASTSSYKDLETAPPEDAPRFGMFHYYSLPIVKLWSSTLCYIGFIILSSIVLVGEEPNRRTASAGEILLYIWVLALAIEECSQILEDGIRQYLRRDSNRMDIIMLLIYTAYFILKCIIYTSDPVGPHSDTVVPNSDTSDSSDSSDAFAQVDKTVSAAVNLLAIATILAYLRLLHVFSFNHNLGPLYFSIIRMVSDVTRWLFVFILFCLPLQFAMMAFAELNRFDAWSPVTGSDNGNFGVAFFTIIGDYDSGFPALGTNVFAKVLLVIYALIAQIVLVNLLIAMMGDTFGAVKENSDKEWKFVRHSLATEYKGTSAIPPPFNLLVLAIKIYRRIRQFRSREIMDARAQAGEENMATRIKALMKFAVDEMAENEEENEHKSFEAIASDMQNQIAEFTTTAIHKPAPAPAPAPAAPASNNASNNASNSSNSASNSAATAETSKIYAKLEEVLNSVQARGEPAKPVDDQTYLFPVFNVKGEKYVVLSKRASSEFSAELPTGRFDVSGNFVGDIAARLRSIRSVEIKPTSVSLMTSSLKNGPRIYLYEHPEVAFEDLVKVQSTEGQIIFLVVKLSVLTPDNRDLFLALTLYQQLTR